MRIAIAASVVLAACSIDLGDFSGLDGLGDFRDGTPGELGRVKAGYTQGCGVDLFSGSVCALDGPVLRGGAARVAVWPEADTLPELTAVSLDPGVVAIAEQGFEGDGLALAITGGRAGLTTIELRDGAGTVYDRFAIEVGDALTLTFTNVDQPVLAGATVGMVVQATDRQGRKMFGRGAMTFDTGDLATTTMFDGDVDQRFAGTDYVVVETSKTLGPAPIAVHAGERTARTSFEVVDETAVDHIAHAPDAMAGDDGALTFFTVQTADGRPIRGAHCAFSVQAPFTVHVAPSLERFVPGLFGGDFYVLNATDHGSAVVTCTLGTATARQTVAF